MEDELTAAFLGDDSGLGAPAQDDMPVDQPQPADDEWEEDEAVPGQLAVDVYETKEQLVVKARTAGVNKSELDFHNRLIIKFQIPNHSTFWGNSFSRIPKRPGPMISRGRNREILKP